MLKFLYIENDERQVVEAAQIDGMIHANDSTSALAALDQGPFDFIIGGCHAWIFDILNRPGNRTPVVIYAGDHLRFEEWEMKIKDGNHTSFVMAGNSTHHDEIGIRNAIRWAESVYCQDKRPSTPTVELSELRK